MAFFFRSKSENPDIFITLDKDYDHLYTCGDAIRGNVHIEPEKDLTVNEVTVHFKGKSKTTIETGSGENRTTYRCKGTFLWLSRNVYSQPITVPGGSHRFTGQGERRDFHFQFPFEVGPFLADSKYNHDYDIRPHDLFEHLPGHLLPPTFKGFGQSNYVEYSLRVVARKFNGKELKEKILLQFCPPRPILNPNPQPDPFRTALSLSNKYLDAGTANEHISFREKMSRTMHGEPRHATAQFLLTSSVPTVAFAGQTLLIPLGVQYDQASSTTLHRPPIILQSIHARLNAYTYRRVPSTRWKTEYVRDSAAKQPICQVLTGTPLSDNHTIYLADSIAATSNNLAIAPDECPSFRTYTFYRFYKLKLSVTVSCANEESELVLANHPFTVLPPAFRVPMGNALLRSTPSPQPPPPYASPHFTKGDEK